MERIDPNTKAAKKQAEAEQASFHPTINKNSKVLAQDRNSIQALTSFQTNPALASAKEEYRKQLYEDYTF